MHYYIRLAECRRAAVDLIREISSMKALEKVPLLIGGYFALKKSSSQYVTFYLIEYSVAFIRYNVGKLLLMEGTSVLDDAKNVGHREN